MANEFSSPTFVMLKSKVAPTAELITETTESWLEENVDPDTGYVLDRTLTMENAAAPADMVGGLQTAITQKVLLKSHGKNLYNPAKNMANTRMYSQAVGTKQNYTTQNGMNVQKIIIDPAETYTMINGTAYAITDADDIVLVQYVQFTVNVPIVLNNFPSGAYYLWIQANNNQASSATQIEVGSKSTAYEAYNPYDGFDIDGAIELSAKDIPVISKMTTTPFNPNMTKVEFARASNNLISTLATTSLCAEQSFLPIRIYGDNPESTLTWEHIFETINKNLRVDVASTNKSIQKNCNDINDIIGNRIYRFVDAKLNNGITRNFSLPTNFQADEPSAIVSEDGETLYIYAHLKRIETKDGVNWSNYITTPLSDNGYIMHNNVAYINGVYYLTGARENSGGNLVLYTSTDGVNFTYQGIIFESGKSLASGKTVVAWGNTFLLYEYGSDTFYLYVEAAVSGQMFDINLATCTDILSQNVDGTIGNWVIEQTNPIITKPFSPYSGNSSSAGNPDFARGVDNRPVRYNGKWYMYFHSTHSGIANILRASSNDLIHWDIDGIALDVRDVPTGGDQTSGNADASIIEFKGRTYMFYTWDINGGSGVNPYIKYLIDDRPIDEIIQIRP